MKAASQRSGQGRHLDSRVLWLAVIRYFFGLAQMIGAGAAALSLYRTGASRETLVMTAVTTAITLTSVLIFRVRWRKQ